MYRERGAALTCREFGFTLMELMITVAVVALLAAVAYPTYQNSVLKSRRTEAKAALTDVAQRLERYYTENNRYSGAMFCTAAVDAGCTDATRIYGVSSENGFYSLGFLTATPPTAATFTIVATPQGAQASDACGSFTLTQTGQRGVTGGTDTDPMKCW